MTQKQIEEAIKSILSSIEREREREIVSRRNGLFERKETLEQIGEMLGITRERVRQLEKAVMIKLRDASNNSKLPQITKTEEIILAQLGKLGNVATVEALANSLTQGKAKRADQARLAFIADLAPALSLLQENDHHHQSISIAKIHDNKKVQEIVNDIIETVKSLGKPHSIEEISQKAGHSDPKHTEALSTTSRHLTSLNGKWGLMKWPTVNPRNIRDKIYVILKQNGKQMHFSDISKSITGSDFKRKDVTTQAIHNELIKDKRFILVGRGMYALKEWGYKQGTVSEVIADVLKNAGQPLHKDEIVKRVLKSRFVKDTTILLNLQSKDKFKRVSKATYALQESK